MRRMHRVVLTAIAIAGVVLSCVGFGHAQSYPNRLIRIIAPYTPGSPNDVMARLLAQQLQAGVGQPVIVDNRPGGGTTIGTKAVATAAPDGYTLLFSSSSLVIDPALHRRVDYDPLNDFAPVAFVASNAWVLTIAPQVPATSVAELVAYARANPGKLSFGFAQGTASQLVGERFKLINGLDIVSVPYKGGAHVVPDILGGRIQMYLPTPATGLPLINDGKLRALAITSAARSPDLPDVPTMAEVGMGELTLDFWAGVLVPAGTPADVVGKLNAAINAHLRSPEMTATMRRLGFAAKIGSPQDFAAFIAEELPRWAAIVKSSGVTGD
jgi:tripartite-type tricarboxylate transporter receptor subunit TctC